MDTVEKIYLAVLRVGVLAFATLCLLTVAFLAGDAAWRMFVSTSVPVETTTVAPAEVAAALRAPPPPREGQGAGGIPAAVRATHAKFASEVFSVYYAVYRRASVAYKKAEDKTLTQPELMSALGYDLDAYASGQSMPTKLFVESPPYQAQAQAAVAAAMSDPAVLRQLTEYKAAQKTAQECSTITERRQVWDPNSTACSDWFYTPYGCNVMRNVPVERCVPAYPDGIVSPQVAFGRADEAFSSLWAERTEANLMTADQTRAERYDTRSAIGPRLMSALKVAGTFLVIMFFFLIITVERHLRRLASAEPIREAGIAPQETETSPVLVAEPAS